MKELYGITQDLIKVFELEQISDFGDCIKQAIESDTLDAFINKYMSVVEDLHFDWVQAVYQYNMASRKDLKQDYTPASLSKLLTEMIKKEPDSIYDVCSGSGSLTLSIAKKYPNCLFVLHELDDTVIPYLLLNLVLHNINSIVINGNVITGEMLAVYRIRKQTTYGQINKIQDYKIGVYDVVVSNPPFNLRNDGNAFFLDYVVKHSLNQGLIILHKPPIKTPKEIETMQSLIDKNLLYRIIYNPDRMFVSTPTTTSILERVILYPPSKANTCSTVLSSYFEKYSIVTVSPILAVVLSILHSIVGKL